mmetsp:Transcript_18958/g.24397  ORF Transcript_18958/g.24397 Transcript_18958/m.24397 type:complete len:169 (+) Transcript_18958:537-1043(+)
MMGAEHECYHKHKLQNSEECFKNAPLNFMPSSLVLQLYTHLQEDTDLHLILMKSPQDHCGLSNKWVKRNLHQTLLCHKMVYLQNCRGRSLKQMTLKKLLNSVNGVVSTVDKSYMDLFKNFSKILLKPGVTKEMKTVKDSDLRLHYRMYKANNLIEGFMNEDTEQSIRV